MTPRSDLCAPTLRLRIHNNHRILITGQEPHFKAATTRVMSPQEARRQAAAHAPPRVVKVALVRLEAANQRPPLAARPLVVVFYFAVVHLAAEDQGGENGVGLAHGALTSLMLSWFHFR